MNPANLPVWQYGSDGEGIEITCVVWAQDERIVRNPFDPFCACVKHGPHNGACQDVKEAMGKSNSCPGNPAGNFVPIGMISADRATDKVELPSGP